VPLISYLCLKGKCKYCHSTIAWHYPFVEAFTAISFITIIARFGLDCYSLGLLYFVSALIAVCITDFKEKLIPHEITYPSILLGIVFSGAVRHDIWGTLAGIGVSYIFFDFMAFYGLKVYLWFNKPSLLVERKRPVSLSTTFQPPKPKRAYPQHLFKRFFSLEPKIVALKMLGTRVAQSKGFVLEHGQPLEEFEVIGGGDAVLSAMISAWLGLNRLIVALVVGFLVGTFMGAAYLVHEMYKQRTLNTLVRPVSTGAALTAFLMTTMLVGITQLTHQPLQSTPWYILLPVAAMFGGIIGVIAAGRRASKPFPFGPALAAGAVIAMFNEANPYTIGAATP